MKYIVPIIRPETLEAVQTALAERDVYLMTVTDVRGCGRQRGGFGSGRSQDAGFRICSRSSLRSSFIAFASMGRISLMKHTSRPTMTFSNLST